MRTVYLLALLTLMVALSARSISAQAPGVSIEPWQLPGKDKALIEQAIKLKDDGKLMGRDQVIDGIKRPSYAKIALPQPNAEILPPQKIAERARKALLRIGWFYLCPNCDDWHISYAGGYAISDDGAVATCFHCIDPKSTAMREGYLVATDADRNVFPVTEILAGNEPLDAAIVRVAGISKEHVLPLNDNVAPGDQVFLFSDPFGMAGYFSEGMINRFYWRRGAPSGNPNTLEGASNLRINVSTDWAPGSSGAPVLDAAANVVGHVAVIHPLSDMSSRGNRSQREEGNGRPEMRPGPGPVMIVLHEAVPARGLLLLARDAYERSSDANLANADAATEAMPAEDKPAIEQKVAKPVIESPEKQTPEPERDDR